MRGWVDYTGPVLNPNDSNAEFDGVNSLPKLTSTGFTTQAGDGTRNYIYVAIRRPNKPAEEFEPEELFALSTRDAASPAFVAGFPADFGTSIYTDITGAKSLSARLIQGQNLYTNKSDPANVSATYSWDYSDGFYSSTSASTTNVSFMLRRAPGFFDVVTYEGDGVQGREVPHNLAAVPEMMWVKPLNLASDWSVYPKPVNGGDARLRLDTSAEASLTGNQYYWGDGTSVILPTASDFTLGGGTGLNGSGYNYIAFLFASVPGICDIGTYTGAGPNGQIVEVDCGFTNGARFVLVKRADGIGNWMYWDALRGVSSTLTLNKNDAAGYSNRYYQWPKGFKVNSYDLDGDEWNSSIDGAEYIYMAIA